MSYVRHFNHGIKLGIWLFLCSIIFLVYCFFPLKFLENFVIRRINTMYHGLMLRWFEDETFNHGKPEKDVLEEKKYKKQYVKLIEDGMINPFSNFKVLYKLLIASISSIVHSFIPQIIVYHSATNVIALYFNFKIMENLNGK